MHTSRTTLEYDIILLLEGSMIVCIHYPSEYAYYELVICILELLL